MTRYYALFFLMMLTIPLFLGINVWQSNECGMLRKAIHEIEMQQEDCVSGHKIVAGEIINLLTTDKLETEAQKMGLHKMRHEDVLVIIMGGKGHGL